MCEVLDKAENKGYEEGFAEGFADGFAEERMEDAIIIMKNLHITLDEALRILEISDSERDLYI